MNAEIYYEVSNFLNREAYLLDHREFTKWLDLFTDDIKYKMPLRVTRDSKDGFDIVEDMAFFDETKKSLTTRVKRLGTSSAWVMDPPPRTRYLITNLVIEEGSTETEVKVRTGFLFMRSRGGETNIEQLSGERFDILRKVDGEWKITSRIIHPDQAVLNVMNLSVFL